MAYQTLLKYLPKANQFLTKDVIQRFRVIFLANLELGFKSNTTYTIYTICNLMTSSELLTLVLLLSPGMALSVLLMLTFAKGG